MFDYFKKIAISSRADDEVLYEFVLNEIETGILAKGLWSKALANSGGDDANAKSIYMKYRVQSIKDIFTAHKIAYNELSKPKLFQYIQDKIFPITNDYTNLAYQHDALVANSYLVSEDEEAIYEEVANELSKDIRKEGLWLKAIQNADGDENRTLALYVKYRSESIKSEKLETEQRLIKQAQIELKNYEEYKKQAQIELENSEEYKQEKWIEMRMNLSNSEKFALLLEFLEKNSMRLNKKVSEHKAVAYSSDNIDRHIEFADGNWKTTGRYISK
jgi:hypothetical protein